ncbi:zinc ribbon domain-containing protein [Crocosphaera watsonii]
MNARKLRKRSLLRRETCSDCGEVNKDLKLSDRTFICPSCGFF